MTGGENLYQVYTYIKQQIGAFDARQLILHYTGADIRDKLRAVEYNPTAAQREELDRAVQYRLSGEPLQYILGQWDFLDLRLSLGPGALIPRPETEQLCTAATEILKNSSAPQILDLCSGTGCIALGMASLCPGAEITAVELGEQAAGYLRRNAAAYPQYNVQCIKADIFDKSCYLPPGTRYDLIISNPPYIPSFQLESLQQEVKWEPRISLDGGDDGLRFYRGITKKYTELLKSGGVMAFEIGIGQADDVTALMKSAGLLNILVKKDYSGIDRMVFGFSA